MASKQVAKGSMRNVLVLALILAFASVVMFLWAQEHRNNHVSRESRISPEEAADRSGSSERAATGLSSTPSAEARQDPSDSLDERKDLGARTRISPEEQIEEYSDWGARDEDDVRWLERHGFPSKSQAASMERLDEATLGQMALNGDLVAQTFLGLRISESPERRSEAIAVLSEAAARGSVRAISARGEVLGDMRTNSFACRDPNAAASFLVAVMLGDFGAVHGYTLCTAGLKGDGLVQVILLAATMYADIRHEQLTRFGPRGLTTPRAGLVDKGLDDRRD